MKQPNDSASDDKQKNDDGDDTKSQLIRQESYESGEEILETDSTKLTVTTTAATSSSLEIFSCLAYCPDNQTLCAGTNQGNLYMWKRNNSPVIATKSDENGYDSAENFWQLCNVSNVRGTIKHCSWGVCDVSMPCVLLNCVWNVYILKVRALTNFVINSMFVI